MNTIKFRLVLNSAMFALCTYWVMKDTNNLLPAIGMVYCGVVITYCINKLRANNGLPDENT